MEKVPPRCRTRSSMLIESESFSPRLIHVESLAAILDYDLQHIVTGGNRYRGALATGMRGDVAQRFLNHPVNAQADGRRNCLGQGLRRKPHIDLPQAGELLAVRPDGRFEAEMGQGEGMKVVSGTAEIVRQYLHLFLDLLQFELHLIRGHAGRMVQDPHLNGQCGQPLADIVVEILARSAAAPPPARPAGRP